MLSRRVLASTACLTRPITLKRSVYPVAHFSSYRPLRGNAEIDDPEMNGGYINPTNDPFPLKRQFRDPYYPWWDKQERRNFGEPVHEDNDILGVFSLEEYTHMTPGQALLGWGAFIATVLGLSYVVSLNYPDRPSAPKEYEGGLESELGGPGAVRAWKNGDTL